MSVSFIIMDNIYSNTAYNLTKQFWCGLNCSIVSVAITSCKPESRFLLKQFKIMY